MVNEMVMTIPNQWSHSLINSHYPYTHCFS